MAWWGLGWLMKVGSVAKISTPVLEGWKYLGGASIAFQLLRTSVFGKTLRTIEYPDGDLITVTVRRSSPRALRSAIAAAQPPLFPGATLTHEDVNEVAAFVPPHFTQPVRSAYDVRALLDNQFVVWSRPESEPIPSRGVKLDHKGAEEDQLLAATQLVRRLRRSNDHNMQISRAEEDQLVDLLVDHDRGMLTLYRCFKHSDKEFRRHALRYLYRKLGESENSDARSASVTLRLLDHPERRESENKNSSLSTSVCQR
eukprot:CAMPEP_0177649790 /NCGR_PEP_ID=MMETSP0447-20121125/11584_1 /TAXON_ID=0 /ORGANISM="Stygamoeba regulata, Strain BSH-02190019" /LENGTH=255 /DNA_ID=CAMNT_0019152591 /DNA_START=20 /DNA_END=790 /DNA_ORIENTATION=-